MYLVFQVIISTAGILSTLLNILINTNLTVNYVNSLLTENQTFNDVLAPQKRQC